MQPVSVCIIAKNEEKKIERCLSSLKPYQFELILVDTGSTDQTKMLAQKYTSKIFDFTWTDDFSAARNFSLKQASNDWIFILDCDEWVESIDLEELDYFRNHLSYAVGSITRINLCGSPQTPSRTVDHTERFFDRRLFHYTGRIHEMLTPKSGTEMQNFLLNTTLLHDGYLMTEQERLLKANRNLTLLHRQLEEEPENPYLYYQLGKGFELLEDYETACSWYDKGLSFALDPDLAYVQAMVVAYGYALLNTKQKKSALQLLNIYDEFAASADFIYLMGLIYKENGYYQEAVNEFQKALTFDFANQEGVNHYLAYYQIGTILVITGNFDKAKKIFPLCGNYQPAKEAMNLLQHQ